MVRINSVISHANTLTAFIKDETFGEPQPTGKDGKGEKVTLGSAAKCVAVKTKDNEPGIDGEISFPGTLILTQSKSVELDSAAECKMGPRSYSILAWKAASAKNRIKFKAGMAVPEAVVDLFTLHSDGTVRDAPSNNPCSWQDFTHDKKKSIPADKALVESTPVVVTTHECFKSVVGPGFASRLSVLDMRQ
jgi:hypothetical protein